ncbi:capsule assembly Wzi family protein [Alcanivorax sediminis]|uniref:Capsule assembly Wzi family protein n=1 Tax=Alcanivorax sediminis TaxID=2663008 RepID=A0A6N7M1M3_9GAMM|nr:capsule assembly Wzi family protein [Alcanivorax sediminis]
MSFVRVPRRARYWIATLLGLGVSGAHAASPWVPTGDLTARHHIETLQTQGCLNGLTLTWPMSWAAVMKAARQAQARLPEAQAQACASSSHFQYLQAGHDAARANTRGVSITLGGANQEPLYTSFDSQPEDTFTGQLALYGTGEHWSGRLAVSYADGERDDQHLRFDDSYLAAVMGNWQLGVGAVDRWWGPGWQSSLALSNNARPVPGVWLSRHVLAAPESPWLRWIGPWDLQVIAGQLEEDRAIPDAKLLGARFVFKPLDSLQIGLSRLAQWGGEGRPQDMKAFWNAFIGRDNGETSGLEPDEDPSNQIAGFDFRLSMAPGHIPMGLYGQFMGEDEAGNLPSKFDALAGLDMVTGIGKGTQRWFVEATETVAGSWISERRYNTMYEHGTYQSGFRYHGRNLASTWEGDARAVTLGIQQYFTNNLTIALNLSQATLNKEGVIRAVVPDGGAAILQSVEEQDVALAEMRIGHPLLGGTAHWLLSASDEPIVTPFEERERWTAGLQWTRDFAW